MYVLNDDTLREAKPDLIIAHGIYGGPVSTCQ
jgi:hypothetical protein